MKFGVLVFPGSNCDHDTYHVIAEVAHQPVTFLWHDSEDLQGVDAVLVPGGDWQKAMLQIGPINFGVGDFVAAIVNFLIIAVVVFLIVKMIMKEDATAKR